MVEKLSAIQQNMKAPKNLYNSFGKYKYRSAEGILEASKPYEREYNVMLTLTNDVVMIGTRIYVKATALLSDCESEACIQVSAFARESEEKKGMDESQITGTASSYARKYALNGLFLLDDTKDADTDEYAQQTGKKKDPERTPGYDGSGAASAPMLKQIESICKKHGTTAEQVCKANGVEWKGISAELAGQMLVFLKKQYGDE